MNEKIEKSEYNYGSSKNQYFAAIACNLIFLTHGTMVGWMSPALPLKSGPLDRSQVSWIGSVNSLFGTVSTFLFGYCVMQIGSKRTMYYHILIARICTGLTAGGVQTTIILYIAEIADNNIRGRLASFSQLSRNIGIVIAYTLGAILPYRMRPLVFVCAPVIFGIWFFLLPNTPQYHFKKGEYKEAENSLKYYKGSKRRNTEESEAFLGEFERLKTIASEQKADSKITYKDILNREALKGILNGIILMNLTHLTGAFVFITYGHSIFKQVGATHIDHNTSSIAVAIMQLVGALCTSKFSDSLGRKALLIISLGGSAFGLLSFALYSYLKQNGYDLIAFDWVPVTSLSFVIFCASSGVVNLAGLVIVENMPSKIRTPGLVICNIFKNIASFYCLKLFPILSGIIQLHGCMLIFATACSLGVIYTWVFIKETKGKDLNTVQSDENDRNEIKMEKC